MFGSILAGSVAARALVLGGSLTLVFGVGVVRYAVVRALDPGPRTG